MKTVVITGSSRGFGLCQAKKFRELGWNVVISATNKERLESAIKELNNIKSEAKTISVICDVTKEGDVVNLWNTAKSEFGGIDIWINNAGVNSPDKPICEMESKEIVFVLDVDLKGSILGSKIAFAGMK